VIARQRQDEAGRADRLKLHDLADLDLAYRPLHLTRFLLLSCFAAKMRLSASGRNGSLSVILRYRDCFHEGSAPRCLSLRFHPRSSPSSLRRRASSTSRKGAPISIPAPTPP